MRNVLTLDFDALTVDSFETTPVPTGPSFLYANRQFTDPTTSPCLDSQQTCGPECIA